MRVSSFPGGRVDRVSTPFCVQTLNWSAEGRRLAETKNVVPQTDKCFIAAALRETREEVGIVPDQVEILGQVGPPQLSLGGLRVWPYVVRSLLCCPMQSTVANALLVVPMLHCHQRRSYRGSFMPHLDRSEMTLKAMI